MAYLKYLLLLISVSVVNNLYSQHIFIGDEETNRKLAWSDFRGPVDRGSSHQAMTRWQVGYRMDNIKTYGDSVHIGKLIVTLKMEPTESWCVKDKITDELLKHEQGHFDIGVLCMREFISIFNQTTFRRSNIDSKMKKMFSDVMNKYHELSLQYDRETDHSKNKDAQELWNTFFEKYL